MFMVLDFSMANLAGIRGGNLYKARRKIGLRRVGGFSCGATLAEFVILTMIEED